MDRVRVRVMNCLRARVRVRVRVMNCLTVRFSARVRVRVLISVLFIQCVCFFLLKSELLACFSLLTC